MNGDLPFLMLKILCILLIPSDMISNEVGASCGAFYVSDKPNS